MLSVSRHIAARIDENEVAGKSAIVGVSSICVGTAACVYGTAIHGNPLLEQQEYSALVVVALAVSGFLAVSTLVIDEGVLSDGAMLLLYVVYLLWSALQYAVMDPVSVVVAWPSISSHVTSTHFIVSCVLLLVTFLSLFLPLWDDEESGEDGGLLNLSELLGSVDVHVTSNLISACIVLLYTHSLHAVVSVLRDGGGSALLWTVVQLGVALIYYAYSLLKMMDSNDAYHTIISH